MTYTPLPLNIFTASANYQMSNANDILLCSAVLTVTLHDAGAARKKLYIIKNYSGGLVTVFPGPGGYIDFAASISLAVAHSSIILFPADNGPHWWIAGAKSYP